MFPGIVYSRAIADEILTRLSAGETLKEVCRSDNMPSEASVREWALDDRDGFGPRYKRAREIGYMCMADEILDIANDGSNDWIERTNARTGKVETVPDHEHINRSRLRVDTYKWLLAKCLPKIFGEKLALTGADGGAIEQIQRIERVIVDPPPFKS